MKQTFYANTVLVENPTGLSIQGKTRDQIALDYAKLISENWQDWNSVNRLILTRYKQTGLEYIKAKAWKLLQSLSEYSEIEQNCPGCMGPCGMCEELNQ